jgi:hypothetical protein
MNEKKHTPPRFLLCSLLIIPHKYLGWSGEEPIHLRRYPNHPWRCTSTPRQLQEKQAEQSRSDQIYPSTHHHNMHAQKKKGSCGCRNLCFVFFLLQKVPCPSSCSIYIVVLTIINKKTAGHLPASHLCLGQTSMRQSLGMGRCRRHDDLCWSWRSFSLCWLRCSSHLLLRQLLCSLVQVQRPSEGHRACYRCCYAMRR